MKDERDNQMSHQAAERPRVALLVDNPYRDLPGLALVAWRLCQRGATCYLVPVNLRHQELWALAPDFILLNHFRTIFEGLVRDVMAAGMMVGVLDTEGSIFSPIPAEASVKPGKPDPGGKDEESPLGEYAFSMARDADLRHGIACFCAWTPAFADYAGREGWYRPEQLVVTGTPRMDYYATQWRQAALRMSSYADDYPEPLVLINSSFTLANPRFKSAAEEAEMMINEFSYGLEYVEKWQRTQAISLELLAKLANKLARHFTGATFVFRPHPFEGEEIYRKLLEPLPNLHLVKKGTVDGWMLRARALVHWGSSTAIDACLASVPAFTAGWIPAHLPVPAVDSVSIRCSTEAELVENIGRALSGSFQRPPGIAENIDGIIKQSFYKIDGRAHQRVADAILRAISTDRPATSLSRCRDMMYGGAGSLTGRTTGWIRKALRLSPQWSFRHWREMTGEIVWDSSDKFFDARQVNDIVNAIAETAPAGSEGPLLRVGVRAAQEPTDYHFHFRQGRAAVVFLEQ